MHSFMKRFLFSLLSLFFFFFPASAESAPVVVPDSLRYMLTLEEAVRLGLRHSRVLEIARLDRQKASEKNREAVSAVLPQISGNVTYTRALESAKDRKSVV